MFDKDRLNFAFPLFTTSCHMLVQFALSGLVLYFIPSLRPQNAQHNSDAGRSRHETEPDRPLMSKLFYLTRIGPCGAATGLDIGLGNTSLKFITLTFYTMCKTSSLAFVLIFAFIFRLEKPTWRLVAIIATMTAGVVLMVSGEVEFKLGGFVLPGWRDVVAKSALLGIPTPAFSTALSWFDGYRTKDLPANLLQAQRDYFGAHTFRVKPEHANEKYPVDTDVHVNWTGRGGNVSASTYQA
ncbi:hypothetical protein BN1708_002463 [Verticillium longisporum]|uniref:phosphogluconate dehydrogenase (NADP(+)-dependent, decarboxylating) n=1 Tax=Verticillium longisporum TaxID=100787 RepID=A0A0G4KUJ1_VERLO|nr:hypothetical protein BN1708_002463 [Verticillium longisporum]